MDNVFGPNEYNTHKPAHAQPINWNAIVFNGFVAFVTLALIACVQLFVPDTDNPLLKFVMIALIVLLSFTTIRRGPLSTEVNKDDNE